MYTESVVPCSTEPSKLLLTSLFGLLLPDHHPICGSKHSSVYVLSANIQASGSQVQQYGDPISFLPCAQCHMTEEP